MSAPITFTRSVFSTQIPMTVLKGHLSALRNTEGGLDPEVLHDAMEEVQYITSLLQDLGASAKLEAGELAVEQGKVDMNAIMERVVARHSPIARQKGVEPKLMPLGPTP